ncbi:hypothetical protein R70723_29155 [Paenibacillus sp. FSL R7-0273]|nr:hypothetical protein R70723_29155 [Paenibacillus sp. FSL R7-0273]OMF89699.1 hypothetical protein BK144_19265 [Paenibacillus sp. FSL R7-0273]
MFGGDLPVIHQSRKYKRKMLGRPFTQRLYGCTKILIIHGYALTENTYVLLRQRRRLWMSFYR